MTGVLRRAARTVLTRAVRGRGERGGTWGEAVLREFDETSGAWPAVRWAASGLRVAWRERRAGRGHATRPLPVRVRLWRRLLPVTVAVVALAFVLNWWVAGVVYVASQSMDPTLRIGDRVLVDKVGYHWTGLHHGDLVLVDVAGLRADGVPTALLRRVIGLPGDRIACGSGYYYRDGVRINEPRLPAAQPACTPTTVPPGQLYLAGDNAVAAMDSRQMGTVPRTAVVGRVLGVVWHGSGL